jgi:hypothetical protein
MELEKRINEKAFDLYKILTIEKVARKKNTDLEEEATLIGEVEIATFKLKENNLLISTQDDVFGNITNIKAEIGDEDISYNIVTYKTLQDLASLILKIEYISKYADSKFVEREIFNWIVDLHTKKRVEIELVNFIKIRLESELADYTFYFKVKSLIIENEFKVGNCLFTSLGVDFFENEYNKIKETQNIEKNEFIEFNKDFINSVIISCTTRAIQDKSKNSSKKEVELSINAIKCFLINESLSAKTDLFNADFLHLNAESSKSLSKTNLKNSLQFHWERINGVSPITLKNGEIKRLESFGLEKISEFIKEKKQTEYYFEIEDSINLLGEINSTTNLYSRAVKLVSFFEGLIIPKNNLKAKGLTNLKKVIQSLLNENYDEIFESARKVFDVRDKYLHNRIEMPISTSDFFTIQKFALAFLLAIIEINFDTKEDMLTYFEIIKNSH